MGNSRNVYHINEVNETRFYKLPKQLFLNTYYHDLSSNAKILYGVLLDRMELSKKNNWVNKNGEIYLIFTRKKIAKLLNISRPTTSKAFKELRKKELIFEEKRGFNQPNKIFIGKLDYSKGMSLDMTGRLKFFTSTERFFPSEVKIFSPSDTELNETDLNETEENENGLTSKVQEINPSSFSFYDQTIQKHLIDNYNLSDYIYENVVYYLKKYTKVMGRKHPQLKKEQWDRVFRNIIYTEDMGMSREFELLGDRFRAVVDQHFTTNYPMIDCDYNILHFISVIDIL